MESALPVCNQKITNYVVFLVSLDCNVPSSLEQYYWYCSKPCLILKNVRTTMQISYTEHKTVQLNQNLLRKFEEAFKKQKHVSSKFIGERRIKSRLGSRVSLFPSVKNCGLICLESNLELAHAIGLERNEDILQYRTQAVQIFISDQHFIIPDFIVKTLNGFEVHEIKPNLKTISEKTVQDLN